MQARLNIAMARKGRMKSSNKKTHRRVTYPIPFLFSLDVEMLNSSIFNTIFQNNLVFSSKFTIFRKNDRFYQKSRKTPYFNYRDIKDKIR